ncbi:hypothetical protein [Minwuia sp. IMCC3009]|uniref:hypothetical protein n=1 Tax=Minwuia sp. IMCC3009 TaxID=3040674 RepID=UPI002479DE6C|nr:hypothetical protein [Minwuia sp. IMCC3009]
MVYLDRKQASEHLISRGVHYSRATLQKLATTGGGPVYRICGGRALYTVPDLDAWIEERMSPPRRSTSEVTVR